MTIIDMTNEATRQAVAATQTAHALALELNSGMKVSNRWSPLKVAKGMGFKGSRKPQALAWLVENFQLTPTDSIKRALAKHGLEVIEVPAE